MSKNLLTIILFSVVIFLSVYSVWRISQPRVLSAEEMKVNGYYGYGSFQELRDFNLVDHNGTVFTKENLKEHSLNFLYFGYSSCPTECPVMMSVMRQVYEKIETDSSASATQQKQEGDYFDTFVNLNFDKFTI